MSYEAFFAGVGGIISGTLLGSLLTYRFQKHLLDRQLDFEHKLLQMQLAAQRTLHGEFMAEFKTVVAALDVLIKNFNEQMNQVKGYFREMTNSVKQFEKQVQLTALTSYANLTVALWEHDEKAMDTAGKAGRGLDMNKWAAFSMVRYEEMIKARKTFERLLKDTGLIE
jgi:hypothetical protein